MIFKIILLLVAFDSTIIDLLIGPAFAVLYFILILALCPGINGSFDQEGTAHPQDERMLERTNGALPVFCK